MPDEHGICEHCSKTVTWQDGYGYIHDSTGYFHCTPGRPEEAMTTKFREALECNNA